MTVGIRLVAEVLDNAPMDLTPAERLMLVALAEDARDETRVCWPGMDKLVRRTGLQPDSIRRVFQRLAKRGLEVRVPIGKDKQGRPIFAREHVQTNYRLPVLMRRDEGATSEAGPESPLSGGTTVPPQSRDENPATLFEAGPQSPPEAGRESRPSPQPPHSFREEPNPSRSRSRKKAASAEEPTRIDVEQLCNRMISWLEVKDYRKRPKAVTDAWRKEARLLLDEDKVDLSEALDVLDWSQRDHFWKTVLHSIPKFRNKFADLEVKSRGLRGGAPARTPGRTQAPGADPRNYRDEEFHVDNFG
ncbi:helix-turn-helix domain-containing protein [Microtetraspora sp. AC03309]|uniref:helix-turn-helix domain-containing protein n=1 Tax=Microtetraspora sp. AC03309 TaxID=2779376 RepID=UPI001E47A9C9|nr:helix-turn-helix domain-containing protein [Microtetraspora sp. AC03309]MCC5580613.1 helix-turn-helix domain-containing protein [Microtetraspora sp. AC03309]